MVHGGAGNGKSFSIKAISYNARKILAKSGEDITKPKILICAPTGKAASLVGKFYKY